MDDDQLTTPGPWRITKTYFRNMHWHYHLDCESSISLIPVGGYSSSLPQEVAQKNAAAISLAPEMVAALDRIATGALNNGEAAQIASDTLRALAERIDRVRALVSDPLPEGLRLEGE